MNEVLQPGETIRQVTTLSWVVYLRGIILCAIAVLVGAWASSSTSWLLSLTGGVIAAALFVVGLGLIAHGFWHRMTTEVAVTDRRVIYKTGFINRHTVEMHMDKIESVDVDQSILGRLLNYGDITIYGTGEGREHIREIERPLEFRNHVTAA